jgi:hypothetical protein
MHCNTSSKHTPHFEEGEATLYLATSENPFGGVLTLSSLNLRLIPAGAGMTLPLEGWTTWW